MSRIADRVTAYAAPLAEQLGLTLWHVEFGKEAAGAVLRLTIDKPGGIGTDDCEQMSKAIDPWLDEEDFIPGAYSLEVSSPGIERVLYTDTQRKQFIGTDVDVKLYKAVDGKRTWQGVLTATDEQIILQCDDGEKTFDRADVAQIKVQYKE
ncbi:MAG: ribosome maturation factor RimP [Oscillospiraceae bacterium]|nr:ribosome maturation factor RimP [Oscillospiraceae bacterium]